jgi:hypothetical protein
MLAIRLESKGKVLYIKKVGRKTLTFKLDQCVPVQTHAEKMAVENNQYKKRRTSQEIIH